jgi:predicted Rossmann fold flavoprotein
VVTYKKTSFKENILFTHRGLSGPAILQISSYLEQFSGQEIIINLLPDIDLFQIFAANKNNKQILANYLKTLLPNRFIDSLSADYMHSRIVDLKLSKLETLAQSLHQFKVLISGNEGYLKAEVTAGGVDTKELSSKTMAYNKLDSLFFIGEVVDVTGWLGGYNFQWAWSSGYAAGISC